MAQIVDNFDQLGQFIERQAETDNFWLLQIIKRRKDNPGLSRNEKMIDNFYIKGKEDLFEKRERIIEVCEVNNARAYFRVNRRNYKKVALYMMKNLADHIATGNYKDCRNVFLRTSGQYNSESLKKWIVDIDNKNSYWPIIEDIGKIVQAQKNDYIYMAVPTVNGTHLVTIPFNVQEFNKKYPEIEIHKDNPTLLYFKKLDNEEFANSILAECDIF